VNRSEDGAEPTDEDNYLVQIGKHRRHDERQPPELDIRLRVSYRSLALVVILFSAINRIISSLSGEDLSTVSEMLFGWIPL